MSATRCRFSSDKLTCKDRGACKRAMPTIAFKTTLPTIIPVVIVDKRKNKISKKVFEIKISYY